MQIFHCFVGVYKPSTAIAFQCSLAVSLYAWCWNLSRILQEENCWSEKTYCWLFHITEDFTTSYRTLRCERSFVIAANDWGRLFRIKLHWVNCKNILKILLDVGRASLPALPGKHLMGYSGLENLNPKMKDLFLPNNRRLLWERRIHCIYHCAEKGGDGWWREKTLSSLPSFCSPFPAF